jgi:hypothetical protein
MDPNARPERRFLVSDAMVLIAATAVALGGYRWLIDAWRREHASHMIDLKFQMIVPTSFIALSWTLVLLPLGWREPRRFRRERDRRPGIAMSVAVVIHMAFEAFFLVGTLIDRQGGPPLVHLWNYLLTVALPYKNAIVVAIAWTVLWRAAGWRPEPSWIDRLGRALGVFWVGAALLLTIANRFWL